MKIGVLLSGCGVYDGTEIQEAVLSLLAIAEEGHEAQCIAVNKKQHHVINHATGEEMPESRNMLVEAARIARGNVVDITTVQPAGLDALLIPGGFGNAKNLTDWAFKGPDGDILPEVKLLLVNMYNVGKPVIALCVSPVVLAKAFEDSGARLKMTLGSDQETSPYDIPSFHAGLEKTGALTEMKGVSEILIDYENRVITAPCYMMEASIVEIRENIRQAVRALEKII
ncbi:MAG: isoprenoid biosynthesis glyoxalase ElbB [Bacteroidota bacterium]